MINASAHVKSDMVEATVEQIKNTGVLSLPTQCVSWLWWCDFFWRHAKKMTRARAGKV